jgi:hypothetical protein
VAAEEPLRAEVAAAGIEEEVEPERAAVKQRLPVER